MSAQTQSKEVIAMQNRIAELEASLAAARNRSKKTESEYFLQDDAQTAQNYAHLSQTARHFESKHRDILDAFVRKNANQKLTMKQFHELLASSIRA